MITLKNVTKNYETRRGIVAGLDGVSLSIDGGKLVCIRGPSGCGKTTLLLTVGGMMRPTGGRVLLGDTDVYGMSAGERADFRGRRIGFVFQMFHLVPYLSVLDNVLLPARGRGDIRQKANELLDSLGLSNRAHHKPSQLSAGERQRTALARAMLLEPEVILADEPTGNLDEENAAEVFKILSAYRDGGGTILVVTHGPDADGHADRTILMREGRVVENGSA